MTSGFGTQVWKPFYQQQELGFFFLTFRSLPTLKSMVAYDVKYSANLTFSSHLVVPTLFSEESTFLLLAQDATFTVLNSYV